MNAAALLDRAISAGIEIFLVGDRVRVRAPRRPPDDLLEAMRQHKAELLALLDTMPRRYSYRYRLHGNEGGGMYLTDEADLERVRDCLLLRYCSRLVLVARA